VRAVLRKEGGLETVSLQSLSQMRARDAWEVFDKLQNSPGFKELADEAKKLPMRVKTSGLLQALAFMRAKGEAPELRKALSRWVLSQTGKPWIGAEDELLDAVRKGDLAFLRRATTESLAWLEWFVRFSEPKRKELASCKAQKERS